MLSREQNELETSFTDAYPPYMHTKTRERAVCSNRGRNVLLHLDLPLLETGVFVHDKRTDNGNLGGCGKQSSKQSISKTLRSLVPLAVFWSFAEREGQFKGLSARLKNPLRRLTETKPVAVCSGRVAADFN